MGIPEIEANRYEGKLAEGNILVSVHTESSEEIERAKDIFNSAGAHDVCTTNEADIPDGRIGEDQNGGPPGDRDTMPAYLSQH